MGGRAVRGLHPSFERRKAGLRGSEGPPTPKAKAPKPKAKNVADAAGAPGTQVPPAVGTPASVVPKVKSAPAAANRSAAPAVRRTGGGRGT